MKTSIASGSGLFLALALLWGCCTIWRVFAEQAGGTSVTLAQLPTISPGEPGLAIFYCGGRQGTLEPCGCHTRQQGGLQLEASMFNQYKSLVQLRLDAGEWTSPLATRMPTEPVKTSFLLRGLKMLDYDALNVGMTDAQLSATWFETLRKKYPDALQNLVSANVMRKDQPEAPAFPSEKIIERKLGDGKTVKIGITGVAALSNTSIVIPTTGTAANAREVQTNSFIVKDPQSALMPVIARLRPAVDLLVVLYNGDLKSAVKLAATYPQIDLLITSARNLESAEIFLRQGNTIILANPSYQGKEIGMLNIKRGAQSGWQPVGQGEKIMITKEYPNDARLTTLIEEFKKSTQSMQAEMPPVNAQQLFAGDDKCIVCHRQEYEQWRGTPHAHAMATLVERNQQFNSDCVRCHVTGFKNANGFWHITDSHSQLYMSNVQCEVCHGPAMAHVNDMLTSKSGAEKWMPPAQYAQLKKHIQASMPKRLPETDCRQCHTVVTDPDFNYAKKIDQVNHTRPYSPDPGSHPGMMHPMDAHAATTTQTAQKVSNSLLTLAAH